jgi:predicted nucleic acid-binding Zn finger protein
MTKRKKNISNIKICVYCGCEFEFIGRTTNFKYCSNECATLANIAKARKHILNTLGTTDLSSHKIDDFEKEYKRIKKEKRMLGLS